MRKHYNVNAITLFSHPQLLHLQLKFFFFKNLSNSLFTRIILFMQMLPKERWKSAVVSALEKWSFNNKVLYNHKSLLISRKEERFVKIPGNVPSSDFVCFAQNLYARQVLQITLHRPNLIN